MKWAAGQWGCQVEIAVRVLGHPSRFHLKHAERHAVVDHVPDGLLARLAGPFDDGVGVIGGLVNIFFYYATESVRGVFMHPGELVELAEKMDRWQRVLTPTLGGLAAGMVLHWGLRLAGPAGRSTNLLEVVVAGDGRLPFRSGMIKFLSSLISIGSGGSIGREGGITQLSATFASKWGQLAKWPPYRLRLLVGCGAASGIAAAYNAPISGAVFAALIVLGNFSMSMFGPLVFASVVATMVSRSFFGIRPWYTVPAFDFTRVTQLPWFVFLGLLAGMLAAAFLKLLNASEEMFKKIKAPAYVRLALGGLVVGIIAIEYPGVWGNGYYITNRILHGEYGPSAISPADISNVDVLAAKLKHPVDSNGVSEFVVSNVAPATLSALSNYNGGIDLQLQRMLAADLTRIIQSGPIYDAQRFTNVTLSAATLDLLNLQPRDVDLARLNRMLLLDAYPQELSRRSAVEAGVLFLLGLLLAKLIATLATVGSGAVGGVFTPTLFLGAGLGALFGQALKLLGGGAGLPVAPFAVVGMGSMLSATTRSPLLAMIMIVEISGDYSLMPALMLGCVVSMLMARRLHPDSIYTEPLRRKGLLVPEEPTASEAATERIVGDVMRAPVPPVRETATLREIASRFLASANNFLPVVDAKGQLVGLVALQDLKEYLGADDEFHGVIAYDLMRPPPACVTPNQRLLDTLPVVLASEQRNIPVVNTLKENRLVGALVRAEVLGIFSEAIATRSKG